MPTLLAERSAGDAGRTRRSTTAARRSATSRRSRPASGWSRATRRRRRRRRGGSPSGTAASSAASAPRQTSRRARTRAGRLSASTSRSRAAGTARTSTARATRATWRTRSRGRCPSRYSHALPQISLIYRYPIAGGAGVTLASGGSVLGACGLLQRLAPGRAAVARGRVPERASALPAGVVGEGRQPRGDARIASRAAATARVSAAVTGGGSPLSIEA